MLPYLCETSDLVTVITKRLKLFAETINYRRLLSDYKRELLMALDVHSLQSCLQHLTFPTEENWHWFCNQNVILWT